LYSVPEPDPESDWIIVKIFQKAVESGWGGTRLAKFFNNDESIPAMFKPFSASTIEYILANEIYIGAYVWGALCTDIVNDVRIVEANPHPEEILRIEGFCRPIIDRPVFEAVRAMRAKRSAAYAAIRAAAAAAAAQIGGNTLGTPGDKLIQPMAAGISIFYPWAGMVRCGTCKASMVPRTSGRRSKAGTTYTYYVCPRYADGACSNAHHVREQHLARAATNRLRSRLFPPPAILGTLPDWFALLVEQVGKDLAARRQTRPAQAQAIRAEIDQWDERTNGWMLSLGNPKLPPAVRQQITEQYEQALARKNELESRLAMEQAMEQQLQAVLDPHRVLDGLARLDEVLGAGNATLLNLELAKHVERIDVHSDRRVVMKGTYLGVFEGGVELLSAPFEDGAGHLPEADAATPAPSPEVHSAVLNSDIAASAGNIAYPPVQPRRLTPRRVDTLVKPEGARVDTLSEGVLSVLDPKRFAGLSPAFQWEEKFEIGATPCWAAEHAEAVLQRANEHPGETWPQRARHFGVSIPTVRKAMKLGQAQAGIEVIPRKIAPRGVADHRDIADESARLYLDGNLSIREIAERQCVNQVTVSKALDLWYEKQGLQRPDGRATRKIRVKPVARSSDEPPMNDNGVFPDRTSTHGASPG
jgi:hypothetical protein